MASGAVIQQAGRAVFRVNGRLIAQVAPSDIRRVHEVTAGSDVYANDQQFWIFELADSLLIVPDDVLGLAAWLQAQLPALRQAGLLHQARCDVPPRAWRKTFLSLFPRIPVKLCTTAKVDLARCVPGWEIMGPDSHGEVAA